MWFQSFFCRPMFSNDRQFPMTDRYLQGWVWTPKNVSKKHKAKLLGLTCLLVKKKFNETQKVFSINYPLQQQMSPGIQEWTKKNLWKPSFKKFEGVWSTFVCLSRPYHFKFFKGCPPQILLGPLLNTLNTLSHIWKDDFQF